VKFARAVRKISHSQTFIIRSRTDGCMDKRTRG